MPECAVRRVLLGSVMLAGCVGHAGLAMAQPAATSQAATQAGRSVMHAAGTFQVEVKPQTANDAEFPRMSLEKKWSGEIRGSSKGEMLTSSVTDSGLRTYVAMERMDVAIGSRRGTFLFRHFATMLANDPKSGKMEIAVVSDSGTGELAGIAGTLQITITGGEHRYDFAYTLPEKP